MLAPDRVGTLPPGTLTGIQRGVEKESLRVRPDGALAVTPHPAALGSALISDGLVTATTLFFRPLFHQLRQTFLSPD